MRLRVITTAGRGLEETRKRQFSPIVYEGEDISDSEDDGENFFFWIWSRTFSRCQLEEALSSGPSVTAIDREIKELFNV